MELIKIYILFQMLLTKNHSHKSKKQLKKLYGIDSLADTLYSSSTKRFRKLNFSSDETKKQNKKNSSSKKEFGSLRNSNEGKCKSVPKLRFTTINSERFVQIQKEALKKRRQNKEIQRRNKNENFNTCGVTICEAVNIVDKKQAKKGQLSAKFQQINYHIITFGEFVNYLKKGRTSIVGYQTVIRNMTIDYFLMQPSINGSFLNGSEIAVKPIFKKNQPIINLNSFEIIKCVGTGGFSKVFLCRFLEDGNFYAMKVIEKHEILKKSKHQILLNELETMKKLQGNPFIIGLKFAFETNNFIIFVMQYCPGSQFFNLIKRFRRMDQNIAKFYMTQILIALDQIHSHNILYRDFKPENIILDIDGHIRITDFGLSKPLFKQDKGRAFSFCGSPQYMPPQIIIKTGHSFQADFYSLGALLYQMLTGLPPFYSQKIDDIYDGTLHQSIKFPKNLELSKQVKSLILGLLNKNQKHRLGSIHGVKQILASPWFGKIKKSDYLQKKVAPPVNFGAPELIDFSFKQFESENSYIDKIVAEKLLKKTKDSIIFQNFYYDSRKQFNGFEVKQIDQLINLAKHEKTQRRSDKIKSIKKYAFAKRQVKFAELRNKINNKSSANNMTVDFMHGQRFLSRF